MSDKKRLQFDDAVEWRTDYNDLSPAQRAHYDKLKAEIEPGILAFKALRERLGMTQKEMAELLMTTQSNVSKIEAKSNPNISVLRRMVEGKGGKLKLVVEMADGETFELAA